MQEVTTVFEDDFSYQVWHGTYRDHKDTDVDSSFMRVATAVASVEPTEELRNLWRDRFYDTLSNFKVTAGGRIYSNAGTEWNGTTLMNCFVGPKPEYDQDSLEGIFQTLLFQAQTLKSEGGWGMNFSFIRPRGSFIHGIGSESPGAVKYMEIFDKSSDIITAGSGQKKKAKQAKDKIRKGAMMGVLSCVTGDTLVSTLGGKIPIRHLVDKNPLVYCTDTKGNVFVRRANKVWKTGVRSTVIVKFDDDTTLQCTADHRILKSDGTYAEAGTLKLGDSVAAFHKVLHRTQQGRVAYYQLGVAGTRKLVPEHWAVAEMKYGRYPSVQHDGSRIAIDSEEVHHADGNSLNNDPDNLAIITRREHIQIHKDKNRQLLDEQRAIVNAKRKGKSWEEFYGEDRALEIKAKFSQSRNKNKKPAWNKGMTGESYKSHFENGFLNQFSENANHKVVSVEAAGEEEVFDISVPEFHNFVANGIFVHNCWHPDIEEFITAKLQENRLAKFNISVDCTNEFMDRVVTLKSLLAKGVAVDDPEFVRLDKWDLVFPNVKHPKYKEVWNGDIKEWRDDLGYEVVVYKTISTLALWDMIVKSTYTRNDPGVLFLDRANQTHCWNYGGRNAQIRATNPCGEQCLPFGAVCNLASVNLTQFVDIESGKFDLDRLKKYVAYAVRFLDDINSYTKAPLSQYLESIRKRRRIGLGVMGWGSALYMLKVRFGSDEAERIKAEVMKAVTHTAVETSIDLAEEKGMFEDCDPVKHSEHAFWKQIELPERLIKKMRKVGIRNSALFSIQPTGNTSIFANVVSGGLEPVFLHEYIRTVIVNVVPDEIRDVTPKYWEGEFKETSLFKLTTEGSDQILKGIGPDGTVYKIDRNRGLTKEVLCEDYGVRHMRRLGLWDASADWAATTTTLTVEDHIRDMQGFGRWIDSSMSKTVNVPNDYPFEKFENVYLDAYKTGFLKGVTTYRDGTMTTVLSAVVKEETKTEEELHAGAIVKTNAPKRPEKLPAAVHHITVKGDQYFVMVGLLGDEQDPYEVFAGKNGFIPKGVKTAIVQKMKRGHYQATLDNGQIVENIADHIEDDQEAVTRLISSNLRHGCDLQYLVHQLEKTRGDLFSYSKAISRALKKHIPDGSKVAGEACATCNSESIIRQEGCLLCSNCGASKCG